MVFSSLAFLIVFLPVLAGVFFLMPSSWGHARQYVLLLFSVLFYASGEPLYVFLIAGCVGATWMLSGCVARRSKLGLWLSILVNIVPLFVTKYAGFAVRNLEAVFGVFPWHMPSIAMPIGISFYTFQVIAYLVDLYQGKVERQRNPFLFALYILFFPQLVAGPIVKYSEVSKELAHPDVGWDNVKYGVGRFVVGLGKKVLIANQAGFVANSIQGCDMGSLSMGMAWLGVLAYTVQIYFDFSGYSEMAIGLGSFFGFHFPENFRDPYTSGSISDFWRRWHVTLGRFFRDYVYIPLGGNRVGKLRWMFNMFVVWMLTGLWHGASWNFVVWGLYYGFLIVVEKTTGIDKRAPKPLGWMATFFFVAVGWGIFMCDGYSFGDMARFLQKLFFCGGEVSRPVSVGSLKLWGYMPFLLVGFLLSFPGWVKVREKLSGKYAGAVPPIHMAGDVALVLLFAVSLLFLVGGTYNPFIYFRF